MLNADPFVAMAAAAMHTHRLHLGTGVLVPANRLAPVTANCLASLNKLAPGRIHCGLGTGFTARRAIRFLNPELGLINLTDTIPFYISAFGPRGKALTARLGTGWIYGVHNTEQAIAQLQLMQQAWRRAGRDPRTLYAVAQGSGCVLADEEPYDSPRARAQAGPSAVMVLHDLKVAIPRSMPASAVAEWTGSGTAIST